MHNDSCSVLFLLFWRIFLVYIPTSPGDGKGKIATLPASTTGSLSSIITTSIASSEPDRVDHRSGGDGGTGCSGSLVDEVSDGRPLDQKCAISCGGIAGAPGASADNGGDDGHGADIRQEKWWYMTLQIAIPFFVAGVGTIGAGIILGHVEVNYILTTKYLFFSVGQSLPRSVSYAALVFLIFIWETVVLNNS